MSKPKLFTITMEHEDDMAIYNIVTNDIETAIEVAYNKFAKQVLIDEGESDESYRFLLGAKIKDLREGHVLQDVQAGRVTICSDVKC